MRFRYQVKSVINLLVGKGGFLVKEETHSFSRAASISNNCNEARLHVFRPTRTAVSSICHRSTVAAQPVAIIVCLVFTSTFFPVV